MAYRNEDGAVMDRAGADAWHAPEAIPSLVPESAHGFAFGQPAVRPLRILSSCPELDCVRHLLPQDILDAAELRAADIGVGADRVLITWGLIGEETYVAALAGWLGMGFEPLFNTPRAFCPLNDDQLIEASNTGMLRLWNGTHEKIVVAPRLIDSRRMVELAVSENDMARRICLTSTARLQAFVGRHTQETVERRAVDDLRDMRPELSAGVRRSRRVIVLGYALLVILAGVSFFDVSMRIIEILLGAVFLAWTGLRLLGLLSARFTHPRPPHFRDDELPTYSIAIALYRETAAAARSDRVAARVELSA